MTEAAAHILVVVIDEPPKPVVRKRLSMAEKIEILARQAICPACKEPLGSPACIEWHHPNELAISGDDSIENRVAMHKQPCHHIVTNGTKATTAGSSKHKVAKVDRLAEANAEFVARMKKGKPDRKTPSRWAGQKMKSRPFPTRNQRGQ